MGPQLSGSGGDGDERLRSLADNLPDGMIYQLLANGDERRFLYVSGGIERLFGVTAEAALGDASELYRRIEPEFLPGLAEGEAASLASGSPFRAEVAVRRADGSRRWLQLTSARRTRADGLEVWDGIALDITERRQAQEERDRSEKRLEIATNAAAIGIWEWNPQTNEVVYSERAKEICGFPPGKPLIFSQLTAVTHPDDLPHTLAAARRALDPAIKAREVFRYRVVRADTGDVRWVLAHGEATFGIVNGAEVATNYVGTLLDITDQTRAEQALVESEARLRLAVEAGDMAVWELDTRTGAITHTPQLNLICGFPADAQPTLEDFRSRYAPGEAERIDAEAAAIEAQGGRQIQTEFRQIWPDGSEHWLLLRAAVAPDSAGRSDGSRVIGVLMDITERKRTEERMELIARELQHRVKNTLAIVQTIAAQSFRGAGLEDRIATFSGRVAALSAATNNVIHNTISDSSLGEIVTQITGPFRDGESNAFEITGPDLSIPGRAATAISMALHELCTNAVKYGALSVPGGRVRLDWSRSGGELLMTWREEGGPAVSPPERKGFGTRLLERGLGAEQGGDVVLDYRPEGLICTLRARL